MNRAPLIRRKELPDKQERERLARTSGGVDHRRERVGREDDEHDDQSVENARVASAAAHPRAPLELRRSATREAS